MQTSRLLTLLTLTIVNCGLVAVPVVAEADPITHFVAENRDTLVVNANHALTAEDLAALAARDDNGLHLGWFRTARRRPATTGTVVDLAGGMSASAAGPDPLELTTIHATALFPTAISERVATFAMDSVPQGASSALAIPEPTMLLLAGAGLLSLGQRGRRRGRRPFGM